MARKKTGSENQRGQAGTRTQTAAEKRLAAANRRVARARAKGPSSGPVPF